VGQDVDQALRDLARTRADLERDVDELFARLPETDVMARKAKTYGAAAGGAAVTVGLVAMRQRKQAALKARRMEARINAEELARAFSPTPPPEPEGRGRAGLLAALLALLVVALTVVRMRSGDDEA
jgi:hypothetical protein